MNDGDFLARKMLHNVIGLNDTLLIIAPAGAENVGKAGFCQSRVRGKKGGGFIRIGPSSL